MVHVHVTACGEGMSPRICGVPCQNTCDDPDGIRCVKGTYCSAPGCYCDEGLVYDGKGKCHSRDQCSAPTCRAPDDDTVVIEVRQTL